MQVSLPFLWNSKNFGYEDDDITAIDRVREMKTIY